MNYQYRIVNIALSIVVAVVLCSSVAFGQEPHTGKLKISVSPSQAYTFVDQRGIGPGSRSIRLAPGKHTVMVMNYGSAPFERDVDIQSGKTESIDATLQAAGGEVTGPKGRIQLEVGPQWKAGDYAVLLNGNTPAYFVGHVDEFNNDIWGHQELVVPPGSYNVTVTRGNKTAWSGVVPVKANERVIVDISTGKQKIKTWSATSLPDSRPRFKAGTASATVNVAPVSGSISADPGNINCGQPSRVKWATMETIDNNISGMSPVAPVGEVTVSPKQTTEYELTGTGPGGVVHDKTTLQVNPTITAQLQASPAEIKYRRIGDKVLVQDSATLNWSTANADSLSLDQLGTVEPAGTRTLQISPKQTSEGPVDETFTYNLRAANACGGSGSQTASVHLIGSIEPIPVVLQNSLFFPTDYPEKDDISVGLVSSQQMMVKTIAAEFMKYLAYDPEAKLQLVGNADKRGPTKYNKDLSDRRVQSVKESLIAAGVPEDKVSTLANGDEQQLDPSAVQQLQESNPNQPPEPHVKDTQASWLAYNRRVDVVLLPTNQETAHFYPNNIPEVDVVWQKSKPRRNIIASAGAGTSQPANDQVQ